MKLIRAFSISLGSIATLLTCVSPASAIPRSVELVVDRLVGIMDTTKQAATIKKAPSVRMTTCKIKVLDADPNSIYLYQEQALSKKLKQPYRQRFLQIKSTDRANTISSISFKPKKPQNWTGLCDRIEPIITSKDLGKSVCRVDLKPLINVYIGQTKPGGCPTKFRGATTITNTIILHDRGMDTWDRGFDFNGKQIWYPISG